jgi:hypothetical protein
MFISSMAPGPAPKNENGVLAHVNQHQRAHCAAWSIFFEERVLHPHFIILLRIGGLPLPGQRNAYADWYLLFVRILFCVCLILCTSRLVVGAFFKVEPAKRVFYNEYVNVAMVLLHVWLPFAHSAVRNSLMLKTLPKKNEEEKHDTKLYESKDVEDPARHHNETHDSMNKTYAMGDGEFEDVACRSSLQRALAELVAHYQAVAKVECGEHDGLERSTSKRRLHKMDAKIRHAPLDEGGKVSTCHETEECEKEFEYIRTTTGTIAHLSGFLIVLLASVVYVGWVHYDFLGEFTGHINADDDGEARFWRHWFGILSAVIFLAVALPWLGAMMAVHGMTVTLLRCLGARVRLFLRTVQKTHAAAVDVLLTELASIKKVEVELLMAQTSRPTFTLSNAPSPAPPPTASDETEEGNIDEYATERKTSFVSTVKLSHARKRGSTKKKATKFAAFTQRIAMLTKPASEVHTLFDLPKEMRHHFGHDNLAYPSLKHEALLLKREIQLSCSEFDWILAALIAVCFALVALPVIGQFAAPDQHWHFYMRDV